MKYIFLLLFFLIPIPVNAKVQINEIAWMGIEGKNGQYGEWIELYNDGDEAVDLNGWSITKSDKLIYTLSKTISAKGFLLIERKTASIPDPIPEIDDEINAFGNSGLSNTGEDLKLVNAVGENIHILPYAAEWPAGSAETKETMQWSGTKWITATMTPKAHTPADASKEEDKNIEGAELHPIPKVSPNKPNIKFTIPNIMYRGVPYLFEASATLEYNFLAHEGIFEWNMGDGTVYRLSASVPILHTYLFPGQYNISFAHYKRKNNDIPILKDSKAVSVHEPNVDLSILNGEAIQIDNKSDMELDLSGWYIATNNSVIPIPNMTIIAPRAKTPLALRSLNISNTRVFWLIDPSGRVVERGE